MTEANRNMLIRLATAVVMIPVLLALLYLAPPVCFYGLVVVATLVGGLELFAMTHPDDAVARWAGALTCVGVSLTLYFFGHDSRALIAVLFVVPTLAVLFPLWRLGDIATAGIRITAGGFGPLYLALLTALPLLLRDRGPDGPGYVLLSMMLAWMADTFGYFFGRFLGKHKLYEAVSPKKTVEGAVGGLVGAVFGAMFAHFVYLKSLDVVHGVVLGLVAGTAGVMGDLGESLLKRSTGVKDSGQIVPGHGGILDRVDALLLTGGMVLLYTRFFL